MAGALDVQGQGRHLSGHIPYRLQPAERGRGERYLRASDRRRFRCRSAAALARLDFLCECAGRICRRGAGAVTDILFYHLENQPLERVIPVLLEKTLERGWRAVIEAGSEERAAALDSLLWTYRDDSFLAHGRAGDATDPLQPVLITTDSG